MATAKKDLVAELVGMGVGESKSELMKKTNKELEDMITNHQSDTDTKETQPLVDLEALKAQMMAEMKAEMEEKLRNELKSEMQAELDKEVQPKRKVKVENDRLIPVMNITAHGLVYLSRRTGAEWNWERYGDIEYVEMQELLTMRNSQRRFLDEPWILIMDEEVVHYLGLEKMYEKMVHPDNIESVFKMNNEKFKEVLDSAPKGIAQLIVGRAVEKVANGELDSMYKIKLLNEKFNIHLGE